VFIDWYREETQVHGYGKPCTAIPAHTSKSDVLSATTTRKLKYRKKPVPVASHAMGCLRETYDTILQRDLSYSDKEIRFFLLKIY